MAKVLSDAGVEFGMPKGAFYFFAKSPVEDDAVFVEVEALKGDGGNVGPDQLVQGLSGELPGAGIADAVQIGFNLLSIHIAFSFLCIFMYRFYTILFPLSIVLPSC